MSLFKRLRSQSSTRETPPQPPSAPTAEERQFRGNDSIEVKGESFYQKSLRKVVTELGHTVEATLLPEPDNEFDANAVGVWVAGLKVGHLSRQDAVTYHSAIAELMHREGRPVAVEGRIFGGEPEKPSLGIWLYHDAAKFGLRAHVADLRASNQVLTGSSGSGSRWMDSLPEDRLAAIKYLRERLESETDVLDRHFMFNMLEDHLYASREVFGSALAEFEETCEKHHLEMVSIRPALVASFGGLPSLPTYRQMAIMKQKAHSYHDAVKWVERGLAMYGSDCLREDAVGDLQKRIEKLRSKLG